jgi:hypothetical protein
MEKAQEVMEMRELVTQIAKALVDAPEEVTLDLVEREGATALRVRVARADVGKLIGKQGRTARSIRTILGAVGMKYHHRFTLGIVEEHSEAPSGRVEFAQAR